MDDAPKRFRGTPPLLVPASDKTCRQTGAVDPAGSLCGTAPELYFDMQVGAWCGVHALNNLLGGPYVTQEECRFAARQVCRQLSQAGAGDTEAMEEHLDPSTGWLSLDVINLLVSGLLGTLACLIIHVACLG